MNLVYSKNVSSVVESLLVASHVDSITSLIWWSEQVRWRNLYPRLNDGKNMVWGLLRDKTTEVMSYSWPKQIFNVEKLYLVLKILTCFFCAHSVGKTTVGNKKTTNCCKKPGCIILRFKKDVIRNGKSHISPQRSASVQLLFVTG